MHCAASMCLLSRRRGTVHSASSSSSISSAYAALCIYARKCRFLTVFLSLLQLVRRWLFLKARVRNADFHYRNHQHFKNRRGCLNPVAVFGQNIARCALTDVLQHIDDCTRAAPGSHQFATINLDMLRGLASSTLIWPLCYGIAGTAMPMAGQSVSWPVFAACLCQVG